MKSTHLVYAAAAAGLVTSAGATAPRVIESDAEELEKKRNAAIDRAAMRARLMAQGIDILSARGSLIATALRCPIEYASARRPLAV